MRLPPGGDVRVNTTSPVASPAERAASQVDPSTVPSLELALDLTREQLAAQKDQGTALDTKAGFVLGAASLLTSALTSYKPSAALSEYPPVVQVVAPYMTFVAIGVYALVVLSSFRAFTLRRYQRAPRPRRLYDTYMTLPLVWTQGTVLRTMVAVYESNERILRSKVRWTRAALIALAFEAFVVGLMLVIQYLP